MSKNSFNSLIVEFKEKKDDILSILKIIIDQKKIEEFKILLQEKQIQNQAEMRLFIKSKYQEFIESMTTMNECKTLINMTQEVLKQLEISIQEFLMDFGENFISKINEKEELNRLINEKQKLKTVYIIMAYLNKANKAISNKKLESSIQLIKIVEERFLITIPNQSNSFRRISELISCLRNEINKILETMMIKWHIETANEQLSIGKSIFFKLKNDKEKQEKKEEVFGSRKENEKFGSVSSNIRQTKNIKESMAMIKNTSNLNFMMNKSSYIKNSIMNQTESIENYNLVNSISNLNINHLEYCFNLFNKVNYATKAQEDFIIQRNQLINNLVSFDAKKEASKDLQYENTFTEILGFIIIQIALYDLMPSLYTRRKFEEIIYNLIQDLLEQINKEFKTFDQIESFLIIQKYIEIFIISCSYVGLFEKLNNNDISSKLRDLMKDKTPTLKSLLSKKYSDNFLANINSDTGRRIKIENPDDLLKYSTQYNLTIDDDVDTLLLRYPYELPYTMLVVDFNEMYKKYIKEIYKYLKPLYEDCSQEIIFSAREYIKAIINAFNLNSAFMQDAVNLVHSAIMCNNVLYCLKSTDFHEKYLIKKLGLNDNEVNEITIDLKNSYIEASQSYQDLIYENLRSRLKTFIGDLQVRKDEFLLLRPINSKSDMEENKDYLEQTYNLFKSISIRYIKKSFFEAMQYIPTIYFEFLFNQNIVKEFNINFIRNLKTDLDVLNGFFNEIKRDKKEFENILDEIYKFCNFFLKKEIEYFQVKNNHERGKIDLSKFKLFITKYKNLKNKKDMLIGFISEQDISNFLKKINY